MSSCLFPLSAPARDFVDDAEARALIACLTSGGDGRITLAPDASLNKYLSAPYPRDLIAFASSTANDISSEAFAYLRTLDVPWDYARALEGLRARIQAAYALEDRAQIIFAPSGTDLEYVALSLAGGRGKSGIHNILLGADEVGSGCIHSAHGRYFAEETALGVRTRAGESVAGLGDVSLIDIPLRCAHGVVKTSTTITDQIERELAAAVRAGRHVLLHVVHGSKTGLILPALGDIDRLKAQFGASLTLVVDACQARITSEAIADYLAREAIVFLTGSKFMGGPPFSGFALVPRALADAAPPLPAGFASIFRAAEWPRGWPGREQLETSANPGLVLRLAASIFELERFQAIGIETVRAVITVFGKSVAREILEPLGLVPVEPYPPGDPAGLAAERQAHLIEMQSLITLNVSSLAGMGTFDAAKTAHRALAGRGVRLGQPVKSVRTGKAWAGTLRIGLSMPQISALAGLSDAQRNTHMTGQLREVAQGLRAVQPG